MKHLLKYTSVILLMTLAATLFQSCNKQDPEPPATDVNTNFDDLSYFQNSIIHVDSLGNFKYRAYGEPLNADDTAHLFIGVDELAQAEQFFREWIAPDVEISNDNGNLTCPLTDEDGNAQGTVYFKPASGIDHIAEVTASNDTRLLYFSKITFIHNADWPVTVTGTKWSKFDIVHNLNLSPINDYLNDEDKSLNWVCVRESGNGIKPMFCTVTKTDYGCYDAVRDEEASKHYWIRVSSFCPRMSTAQSIGNMLQTDWDFFMEVFHDATGTNHLDGYSWIDDTHSKYYVIIIYYYYERFQYKNNQHYGEQFGDAPFLLKIDWLDDEDIYDGATIPDRN